MKQLQLQYTHTHAHSPHIVASLLDGWGCAQCLARLLTSGKQVVLQHQNTVIDYGYRFVPVFWHTKFSEKQPPQVNDGMMSCISRFKRDRETDITIRCTMAGVCICVSVCMSMDVRVYVCGGGVSRNVNLSSSLFQYHISIC